MRVRLTLLLVVGLALCPAMATADAQQPAGKQVPPRTDLHGDPLPEGAIARLGSVRFHHQGGVIAAAFSPEGNTILAAGFEKDGLSLRFWETATGKELSRIHIKGADLGGLTFAPNGKTVFVGRGDGVEQYDHHSGKLLHAFTAPQNSFYGSSFAVSADGKWLAIPFANSEYSPSIHLWEVATGKERASFKGQRGNMVKCQCSTDGKRLLTASTGVTIQYANKQVKKIPGSLCVWDIATAKKLGEIANEHYGIALASDGQTAAIQDQNGETRIVDVVTGQTTCMLKTQRSFVEFTPDSKALVTVDYSSNEPPSLWDAATGKLLRRFEAQHSGTQRLAGFSADGKLLALMAGDWKQDGAVLLWDVATGKPIQHAGGHFDTVTAVAFAPGGKLVASGSRDATVRLWDPATGKQLGSLVGHKAAITAIAFSGDGKTLASSSSNGSLRLWDVANRHELAKLDGPEGGAAARSFSLNNKTLVVGGKSAVFQVWELDGSKRTASFPTGPDGTVFALSRDAKLALSANGEDRDQLSTEKLRLWRLPAGKKLLAIDLRKAERKFDHIVAWTAALSADGRLFAASHSRASETLRGTMYADHTLRVFERATGQELHSMPGAEYHALAFSLSGRLLAAGHGTTLTFWNRDADSRVTLWDMATGESIRVCKGHANEVTCVALSPDGHLMASGSAYYDFIWSGFGPLPAKSSVEKPAAKHLGLWWDDLKGNTAVARAAMIDLLAHPEATVKWIGAQIKPAPAVDTERIARLIEELNSPSFKERQKATAALEELGELPERQLRQVLAGKPALETRRRAELLLEKSENAPQSAEQQRLVRAIVVLEWLGTADAQALLTALSKGVPESRQRQPAQAALDRMTAAQAGRP